MASAGQILAHFMIQLSRKRSSVRENCRRALRVLDNPESSVGFVKKIF